MRLTGPAGTAVDTMSRPVSLTRYGALGVLMALQALERMSAPDDSGTGPAVRSLRRKIAGVVPGARQRSGLHGPGPHLRGERVPRKHPCRSGLRLLRQDSLQRRR